MEPTARSKRQSPQSIRIVPYYVTANISTNESLNMLTADDGPVAYALDFLGELFQLHLFSRASLHQKILPCVVHM